MLRTLTVVLAGLLMSSFALATEISDFDRTMMNSLFGENLDSDLKLSLLKKNSEKNHQFYLLRTLAADSEFSAPQVLDVPADEKLKFCAAYVEVLYQVIVAEKPANIQLVHTEGDRIASGYGFRHLARFLKNEPIKTEAERTPKPSVIVGSKTALVNTLKIQNFGYAKHLKFVEKCREDRPIYGDASTNRYYDQRYLSLLEKLKSLNDGSSRGRKSGTESSGAVR